jgi:hypothetical protein
MSLPALNYLSNAARTEGEQKVAIEDQLKGIKQIPGAGIADQALTISAGSVTPALGTSAILVIDTEASAATDDLTNIVLTNIDDGAMVWVRNANAARTVIVKHSAGGSGQISLMTGGDVALSDPDRQWLLLKRNGSLLLEVERIPSCDLAPLSSKSANYTTTPADRGWLINCTANTFTLTLLAAATAGPGFTQVIRNSGNGIVTIDPNAAELIDGLSTIALYPGQAVTIFCTGTGWLTIAATSMSGGFRTGDAKLTYDDTADPGWIRANDTTIGNGSSGATGRANADTEALFTLLWNKIANQWAPVSGGRGGSAAADYAANKTLALSKALGRALAVAGSGTVVVSGVDGDVDLTGDTFTVPSNNTTLITGMPVVFTLSSGTITTLTSGNTYYVIRVSATLIQLAANLADAQNGTAINMTAKSSPVWTLIHSYTARVLGETGGEEAHAESAVEQLSHGHTVTNGTSVVRNIAGAVAAGGGDKGSSTLSAAATGGNAAMNIMQPTSFMNVMIKL